MATLESSCTLPTAEGTVLMQVYHDPATGPDKPWVVSSSGDLDGREGVLVRLHDACFTSEILRSVKCDCEAQLRESQRLIAAEGGVLIYTPHEGRGIGLAKKVAAYRLQHEQNLDTVDANRALGEPDEARTYTCVPLMLRNLGVRSIRLLSNNPFKANALRALGVTVVRMESLWKADVSDLCLSYVQAKVARMGHIAPPSPKGELPARRGDQGASSASSAPSSCSASDSSLDASAAELCISCDDEEGPPLFRWARPSPEEEASPLAAADEEEAPTAAGRLPAGRLPAAHASELLLDLAASMREHAQEAGRGGGEAGGGGGEAGGGAAVAVAAGAHGGCGGGAADAAAQRPFVTLSYAQALDGSICGPLGARGPRLMLSGDLSMALTHTLRAAHGAVLVGCETLLSDNPRLTVRLVAAAAELPPLPDGAAPLRVVADSRLRTPLDCNLLGGGTQGGDGAAAAPAPPAGGSSASRGAFGPGRVVLLTLRRTLASRDGAARAARLREAGALILAVGAEGGGAEGGGGGEGAAAGERLDLAEALVALRREAGVESIMVEGGVALLSSLMRQRLADYTVVTVAPVSAGGLRPTAGDACGGEGAAADSPRSGGRARAEPVVSAADRGRVPSPETMRLPRVMSGVRAFALGDDVVIGGRCAPLGGDAVNVT